tara:strand:- start:957 stop:1628 length:672 start_codon:yes stop_codon:yes gene_type:complete
MSILVIAPHADDETLGMGGTIAKFAENEEVTIAILTGPGNKKHRFLNNDLLMTIRKESIEALEILGVKNVIYKDLHPVTLADQPQWEINKIVNEIIISINPQTIFVPYKNDLHQDHKVISYAVNVSCRPYLDQVSNLKKVLAYETLSETDLQYNSNPFQPNVFIDISSTLELKLKALASYKSQIQKKYKPRTLDTIKALSVLRGAHIGKKAAEAFMLLGEYVR